MTKTNSIPKRSEISTENTWDLTPLYEAPAAFEAAFADAEAKIAHLAAYRGKISQSASDLCAYLEEKDAQLLVIDRLYSYAFQYSDQDTANTQAQAMKNQTLGLYTRFFSAIAWEAPELLTLSHDILDNWYESE